MRQAKVDVEGGLLDVTREGIAGWARIPSRPDEIPRVILLVNSQPLGSAVADRFDLEPVRRQAGPGVGGFVAKLTKAPEGDPPYRITMRSGNGKLLGDPLVVDTAEALLRCVEGYRPVTLEGGVDRLLDGRLEGWLWDSATPDKAATADVFDGEKLLGQAAAEHFRQDLREAGKRGGYCGFIFELPVTLLDMNTHTIRTFASGNRFELRNSPFVFGPVLLSPVLDELSRLRAKVAELTSQIGEIANPGGSFQRDLVRDLALRVSAFAAIQQEAVEARMETALQRFPPQPRNSKQTMRRS